MNIPLTRRGLLGGMAAGLFPTAASAVQPDLAPWMLKGLWSATLGATVANAEEGAFFSIQSGVSSALVNGQLKPTQLNNISSQSSSSSSMVFTMLIESILTAPNRVFGQHSSLYQSPGSVFEYLVVDLFPPTSGVTLYNAATGQTQATSFNTPYWRVKAATTFGLTSFIAVMPRYVSPNWQTIILLLNDAAHFSTAALTAYQFIKNEVQPAIETMSTFVGWPSSDPPSRPLSQSPLFLPVGQTSYANQLDITMGRIPLTSGPGSQGSLVDTTIGSAIWAPVAGLPNYTISQTVNRSLLNRFIQPGAGAPNIFAPNMGGSAVSLFGGVTGVDGQGFMFNQGTPIVNLPEGVFMLDTRFGNYGINPVEPPATLSGPYD